MAATSPTPRARRLAPDDRREQLIDATVAAVASAGYSGLTLDEVAERSGVTRSLIYHYFPRGRQDLFIAAVDRAGNELTENWVVDSDTPIEERLAANFARFFAHALEPSAIWLVHRQASVAGDPEVDEVFEHYRAIVVSAVALESLRHRGSAGCRPRRPARLSLLRRELPRRVARARPRPRGPVPDARRVIARRGRFPAVAQRRLTAAPIRSLVISPRAGVSSSSTASQRAARDCVSMTTVTVGTRRRSDRNRSPCG